MVTTIQLNKNVKSSLDRLKSNKETYEQVIINLIRVATHFKMKEEKLLIEGYLEMQEELSKINQDWSIIDHGWD